MSVRWLARSPKACILRRLGGRMGQAQFRYRGVKVVLDTAESAELDVLFHQIPEDVLDRIGTSLGRLPQASSDRAVGNFLIREIAGLDVVWMIGREGLDAVITIYRIRPPDPANPTEALLQNLNLAAIFRGATGI